MHIIVYTYNQSGISYIPDGSEYTYRDKLGVATVNVVLTGTTTKGI